MGEVMIMAVPPSMTDDVWPQVSGYLDMALVRGGENTLEDTKASIKDGSGLLLVAKESSDIVAACVLELVKSPLKTIAIIKLCGGRNMGGWLNTGMDTIKQIAKEQGANEIQIIGRKGWAKLEGFHEKFRAYTMEVS